LRGLLPPAERHEEIMASAGNRSGWARRFDQATMLDEKAIDAAQARIHRLVADRGLWRDRRRAAETLLEASAPATREQVKARLEQLRAELEAKHAAEAADMAQQADDVPPVPEHIHAEDAEDTGPQERRRRGREFLDQLRAERAAQRRDDADLSGPTADTGATTTTDEQKSLDSPEDTTHRPSPVLAQWRAQRAAQRQQASTTVGDAQPVMTTLREVTDTVRGKKKSSNHGTTGISAPSWNPTAQFTTTRSAPGDSAGTGTTPTTPPPTTPLHDTDTEMEP
ncbi:hypothetical protein, partial [Corynebacterium variabile]|uniref:hypothetical protein n=1 Tax=Corynebacterium variabile TaxID=1727 RepID=UPI003BAE8D53